MADNAQPFIPQRKRSVLLSGLGFYRLSLARRKQLTYVFFGSLIAHVAGLIAFGGYIIMTSRPDEATVFSTPPPVRTYEPRQLEHRVRIQKQQRSSSRPAMMPRMVAMKLSDLSLPEIKVDPKIINTTFQPKFKPVSGKGLGAGLGTGYGAAGFGDGVNTVDFFGIHARGEKVAILLDVSTSMVEEERGGVQGFASVKRRMEQLIDSLGEGTLFNVIAFADAADALFDEMVIASAENRNKSKLFIRPFNQEGNWGLTEGNFQDSKYGLKAYGGTTRLDLALAAAFKNGADTILVFSDGLPWVEKGYTPEQLSAWHARQDKWREEHAQDIAAWQRQPVERVWIPPTPARPAPTGPPREGETHRAVPAQPGRWVERRGGRAGPPTPPPIPHPGHWTLTDFIKHIDLLHEAFYAEAGRKYPVIHCIGYAIDRDGHNFLQQLARRYRGNYRRIRRIN